MQRKLIFLDIDGTLTPAGSIGPHPGSAGKGLSFRGAGRPALSV